jgi:lysophospholipid acyltransferase (LPLAT)-like uncharacterized protein
MAKNHAMPATAQPSREEAVEIRGLQRVGLWCLGTVIRIWTRTLRMRIDAADRHTLARRDTPVALVIWHNRLFVGPEIVRRFRDGQPFHGIISASKDGAWLVGFFEMLGFKAIRGSSSWGAREAATAMIKTAQTGKDLGITPDGPKGPIYEFKPGGLIIARRAQLPMLLIGAEFTGVKQLRSWDRFIIPWPFSQVTVRCREILPESLPKDREAALKELTHVMTTVNGTRH